MPSSFDATKKEKKVPQHILIRYYKFYRHNGASRSATIVSELFMGIMWIFLRMESPFWRKIARKQRLLFPHINPRCPKVFDPLRYLLQSIWLICHYLVQLLVKKPTQFISYVRNLYKKLFVHVSPIAIELIEHKKKIHPFGNICFIQLLLFWLFSLFYSVLPNLLISHFNLFL